MKFDSYARFVRSPLYQNCMLASVEGRPLPDLQPQNKGSRDCVTPAGDRKVSVFSSFDYSFIQTLLGFFHSLKEQYSKKYQIYPISPTEATKHEQ